MYSSTTTTKKKNTLSDAFRCKENQTISQITAKQTQITVIGSVRDCGPVGREWLEAVMTQTTMQDGIREAQLDTLAHSSWCDGRLEYANEFVIVAVTTHLMPYGGCGICFLFSVHISSLSSFPVIKKHKMHET